MGLNKLVNHVPIHDYYTLNSLSLFWLAENVQWILKISACDYQLPVSAGLSDEASASADNPYLDLDYSGYHKTLIQ